MLISCLLMCKILFVLMINSGCNFSIKKRKGLQYAIRSRDSLCSRRRANEEKCHESKVYDYMDLQPKITDISRANLINWVSTFTTNTT